MIHSSDQLKSQVRKMANGDNKKSLVLIRKYIMERFLERISVSPYRGNFVIKGGTLVSSMVGTENRETMDIDTSISGFNLDEDTLKRILLEIANIPMEDGLTFEITKVKQIMDAFEYPGIRIMMVGMLDKMRTPLKIDVSTDDVITPGEIEYEYPLLFEERTISILSYNLETLLAEKLETVLSRSVANTRMRDFYDVAILTSGAYREYDVQILREALNATSEKRGTTGLLERRVSIMEQIQNDLDLQHLWSEYQKNYDYAEMFSWEDVIGAVSGLFDRIGY